MPTLDQEIDQIIVDEKIGNEPANEEPVDGEKPEATPEKPEEAPEEPKPADPAEPDDGTPAEGEKPEPEKPTEPEKPADKPVEDNKPSATEVVEQSKTLIENLNIADQVFDDHGQVRKFEDIVPVGAFLASQLNPVKVVDKDGKEHEFLVIADVPDDFEPKNLKEKLKLESGINKNELKFDQAVQTYNGAKEQYGLETTAMADANGHNTTLANEYKQMAKDGLVPEVEGDPNDPTFADSAAVKELDSILAWMSAKNAELEKKGLGQINSLYVAKQLMDSETVKEKKDDTKKTIDQQRKAVASLSARPASTNSSEKKRPAAPSMPMPNYIESLIAEEGLR